jgi:prepilin-type N-terminal cleavage/methylation domain-containing protein
MFDSVGISIMHPPFFFSHTSLKDSLSSGVKAKGGEGFTVMELLVVLAIFGILAALIVPAFNSIGAARGVVDASYKISEALELARSEAVARRTYVWLGLQDSTNFGNRNLHLGIVYSKDGSTNNGAANIQPVSRSILLEHVGLVEIVNTGTNTAKYFGAMALATNSAGASFSIGSKSFSDKTITFTPMGEAMLTGFPSITTTFESQILIGLRTFRGITESTNNDIAVVVDGSTGIPAIFRKQ